MAKATDEELAELREMLPALEEEAEDAAATHRDGNTEENKAWLASASEKLRYARWRLRGGDADTDRGAPRNPFQDQE
jgi:hypothetical protein